MSEKQLQFAEEGIKPWNSSDPTMRFLDRLSAMVRTI